jgi:predicted nucleic acid-binding protein
VIVLDASVVAAALADDGDDGDIARARLAGEQLFAPGIVDLEVVRVVRTALAAGRIDGRRAAMAIGDLCDLAIERVWTPVLLPRIWELGPDLAPEDAAYLSLAEALGATVVTADRRLARAAQSAGARCAVELLDEAET